MIGWLKNKKRNKRGFTERLYMLNFVCVWLYMISILILTTRSGHLGIDDLGSYASGIPYAFAQLGVHSSLIVWKAKVENCRKYKDVNALNDILESVENNGMDI